MDLDVKQKKTMTSTTTNLFILINDTYICLVDLDVKQKKTRTTAYYFFKKRPQHPRDRLEQKTKKLEFDTETLTEVSFINTYILLDKKESLSSEKKNGHIIRNLPADNNRYYIEHEEGSNTFKILEDPQIKEKNKQIY